MRLELPFNLIGKSTMANHGAYSNPGTRVRAQNKDFGDFSQTDLTRTDLTRSLAPLWHRLGNYNRRQNELRHFALELGFFFRFTGFKRRKYSFSSPIPSMQCSADVRATCRKQQTPQLWMEGTGEGCGFFCSDSCFVLLEYNVSTILSPIVGGWCINFGAIMFPWYYRQTIFFS